MEDVQRSVSAFGLNERITKSRQAKFGMQIDHKRT
jgi:hypothetical protein